MYCMKCGADLPDDAEFCFACGEPAVRPTGSGYGPYQTTQSPDKSAQKGPAGKPGGKRPRRKKGLKVADIVAIVTGLVVCTAVIFTVLKITGSKAPEEPKRPEEMQTAEPTAPPIEMGPGPGQGTDADTTPVPQMPEMPQRPEEGGTTDNMPDNMRPDADPFGQFDDSDRQQERPTFDDQEGKIPEGKFKADECRLEKKDDTYYLYPLNAQSTLFQGNNDTGITFSDGVKISKNAKVGVAISESGGGDRGVPDFTYDYYDFYEKADELFSQSHWQYTDIGYEKEALSFEVGGNVHPMTPVITVNDQGEITEFLDFCFD